MYFVDVDGPVTIPSKAHATPAQIERATTKASAVTKTNKDAAGTVKKNGGTSKGIGGKGKKPTFDYEYLKKHGVPHPDTDPSVFTYETIIEIVDMCAIVTGEADCDPTFHAGPLDLQLKHKGV